jgi:hypothetical protein
MVLALKGFIDFLVATVLIFTTIIPISYINFNDAQRMLFSEADIQKRRYKIIAIKRLNCTPTHSIFLDYFD